MKNIILCILLAILFFGNTSQLYAQTDTKLSYKEFRKQQKTFNSIDGKIKYVDEGQGKVILLLHGVPTSSWLYRKMIPELVESGYRVIAPDMLGFGNSDNPKGYEVYSVEKQVKRILKLMESLQIREWAHVTHDAGGLWTWELIRQSPSKITKLILLNTIIYEEGFHPPMRMKKGGMAKISMWAYRNGITTNMLLNKLLKETLNKNNLSKRDKKGYKRPWREGKTRGMYYFFSNTCNLLPNNDSVIENVTIPVSVIWGKNDHMLQWEPQKEKVMKNLKIKLEDVHIIDAKHFIQEEFPTQIDKFILNFIANN